MYILYTYNIQNTVIMDRLKTRGVYYKNGSDGLAGLAICVLFFIFQCFNIYILKYIYVFNDNNISTDRYNKCPSDMIVSLPRLYNRLTTILMSYCYYIVCEDWFFFILLYVRRFIYHLYAYIYLILDTCQSRDV